MSIVAKQIIHSPWLCKQISHHVFIGRFTVKCFVSITNDNIVFHLLVMNSTEPFHNSVFIICFVLFNITGTCCMDAAPNLHFEKKVRIPQHVSFNRMKR